MLDLEGLRPCVFKFADQPAAAFLAGEIAGERHVFIERRRGGLRDRLVLIIPERVERPEFPDHVSGSLRYCRKPASRPISSKPQRSNTLRDPMLSCLTSALIAKSEK